MSCLVGGFRVGRSVRVGMCAASVVLGVASSILADEPPIIEDVLAIQRSDGSRLVDVWYTLSDPDGNPSTIGLEASDDNGSTWDVPVLSLSGDFGSGVFPGANKHIVWDAGDDLPGVFGTLFKVRVCTDVPAPPGMGIVPAGWYWMGDHFNQGGSNERPVHEVYIDTFYIDRTEVTNQQYVDGLNWALTHGGLIVVVGGQVKKAGGAGELFCDTTTSAGIQSHITWSGSTFGVVAGKENHPMMLVTWWGAAAYANWRSGMEGRPLSYNTNTWACDFNAGGYRLPTEAEWEKAARGALHDPYRIYPWGDIIFGSRANYSSSGDPYETASQPWTTPAGFYSGALHHKDDFNWPGGQTTYQTTDGMNGYGLHDMAGNVWEWTNDWYSDTYYSVSPWDNPTGPAGGSWRVFRGGSWGYDTIALRCAVRVNSPPGYRAQPHRFPCCPGLTLCSLSSCPLSRAKRGNEIFRRRPMQRGN